jgi:hypothetical protein
VYECAAYLLYVDLVPRCKMGYALKKLASYLKIEIH